ncbi:unnamed protein product [Caenorhabditis auriculariae]|uniref:Fatty acid desaturase domain-containing protein n=1 Tax=Caenorhabditis auriculariae TaxID=2777116 RepID=A0A8S1H8E6_9PELO|nr:unnamed protein product [Caenorhabditis auriculariae]
MVAHSSEGLPATELATSATVPEVVAQLKGGVEKKAQAPAADLKTKLPTVDELRRGIPAHCFERKLSKSFYYLFQDFAALGLLYLAVPYFEQYGGLLGYLFWNCLMGVFGFALFVVGHDCLHGSFSDNQTLNDIVGHVAFAPLFSPYFPWQKSHKLHHAFTNHLEKDHGIPWTQDKDYLTWPLWKRIFNPLPFSGWIKWFPTYTLFGYCDGSHFWPYSSLFVRNSERVQCVISTATCVTAAYIAFLLSGSSFFTWFKYYWVPLSFFSCMLVMVTYLQHNEEDTEVYEADEWSFVRGQTQTVDRYYGLGLDSTMHHITDGHVAHHFFNKIPHYNLIEATDGIRKVLEPLKGTQYAYKYQVNYDFFARFLWYNVKLDYLVHKSKGVLQFRKKFTGFGIVGSSVFHGFLLENVITTNVKTMTIPTQIQTKKTELKRTPVPTLPTMTAIKAAVPEHCFVKDPIRSIRYLIQDLLLLVGLYAVLPYVEGYFGWIGLLAWYWAIGFVGCSLFVVGHDCGHGSFSDYEWLNDLCGHLAHAPILAPFWPWQKSHRQHHQYTAHLEKDRGHPWVTEQDFNSRNLIEKYFSVLPISGWLRWNPIYTVVGLPDGSHFWPWSKLFDNNTDRVKCVVSGVACFICGYIAFVWSGYSVYNWVKYYYVPLLFQGLILVMITYLQHQNEEVEIYEPEEWQFVRGQTQTIDRKWGFGLDTLMHNITDGHVAHHFFFTKIPHYNLLDATEGIKKVLKPLDGTPYGYKSETNMDFFFKYMRYNMKLDYLIHKSKGVLQYRVGVEANRKSQ